MKAHEIREKYLKFFEGNGHARVNPAPLVLESDPTTLFTSSGMQPLVPYLMGEPHPEGKRLVNSQPSIRLQDIDEVGDSCHTTFFEMLGNWSLGDYFKKEQLAWFYEFLTKDLGLPHEKLWMSVFEGNNQVPKDEESAEVWKSLGIPEEKIFYYGVDKNWWSRSGTPKQMPVGEIGGPDSEVFFEFTQVKHDPKFGRECHPNCGCGRFLEIGNSVFIQYKKVDTNTLEELPNKNVDFGGGLERIAAATIGSPDVFKVDLFWPIIEEIQNITKRDYKGNERSMRIIADHSRAAAMLVSEGVATQSSDERGAVLRQLLGRAIEQGKLLGTKTGLVARVGTFVVNEYKNTFPVLSGKVEQIEKDFALVETRVEKIRDKPPQSVKTLTDANSMGDANFLRNRENDFIEKYLPNLGTVTDMMAKNSLSSLPSVYAGTVAFDARTTSGYPIEETQRIAQGTLGDQLLTDEFQKTYNIFSTEHKRKSQTGGEKIFKGGLADASEEVVRLHTATHLLHASLRKVLGEGVSQKGSNITAGRLRFDFSHPQKLSDEEIGKVEDLINEEIKKNLPVTFETKSLKEAIDAGALAFFGEKYPERVKVYSIGSFSKEICGGPHVKSTGEIGRVRIKRQEKIGAGLMRIYAVVNSNN